MRARGLNLQADWLEKASAGKVTEIRTLKAEDGSDLFVVDGRSQDSRRSPLSEALKILETLEPLSENVFLYGLSGPALVRALLERFRTITALEPSPEVARAFFSLEGSEKLALSPSFRLLIPGELSGKAPETGGTPSLAAHPGAVRRNPQLFRAFKDFVLGGKNKRPGDFQEARLVIIPPLSGGPASMGGFLRKAAKRLALVPLLMEWPQSLVRLEASLKGPGNPEDARGLFREAFGLLKESAQAFAPDLILSLAQAPLDPGTLSRLKDAFPETIHAFWFAEDLDRFGYALETAPLYDLFLHIQGPETEKKLREAGCRKPRYLPLCADADFFHPREVPPPYQAEISFMGAGYPNRRSVFRRLLKDLEKGKRAVPVFKIFGSGWEGAGTELESRLFEGGRRVTAEETALIYAGAEAQLNIHSGGGSGYSPRSAFVNPRAFEIAASGAFQITDSRPLLSGLFTERELAVSSEPDDLPELVLKFLENPEERRARGAAARERVLKAHLYRHRLEKILELAFS
jgi:spore maturation protein CgeB